MEQQEVKKERKLKLNVKNTFKIAFAFFGILMLWQVYNTYCPIILEAMLGPKHDYLVGIIMALDNVVALLIMPIFGKLSDKTNTKWGKRMPYIVIGMALTAILFPFIALMCVWNSLAGVIVFMLLFLIIMQAYRNPAVALMPDITPKPLRSRANGIINLVGYIGGVFATVLGMLPFFKMNASSSLSDIQSKVIWPFAICTAVFVIVLIFLIIAVKEKKLLEETKDDVEYGESLSDTKEVIGEDNKLSKADKRNLMIILGAVFLWFMAFNAFETFGSLFFKNVVGDSTLYSLMATVLSVVSIVSFILFSSLSEKIGRKWTILSGLLMMVFALVLMAVVSLTVKGREEIYTANNYVVENKGDYHFIFNSDNAKFDEVIKERAKNTQYYSFVDQNNETKDGLLTGLAYVVYENDKMEVMISSGTILESDLELKGLNKGNVVVIEKVGEKVLFFRNRVTSNFINQEKASYYTENVKFIWKLFFVAMSAILGIGWALININSFPMAVEYSNSGNLGKFTGYYYMASMLAQSITPILVGIIMDNSALGQRLLFVYASVLMALAFGVFVLVKEKISIKERMERAKNKEHKSALENLGDMDD